MHVFSRLSPCFQISSVPSIDQEIDMATNNSHDGLDSASKISLNSASKIGLESASKINKSKVTFDELASQERRTRIAFLENQQAELETEIRLLKQNNGNSKHPSQHLLAILTRLKVSL